MPIEKSNKGAYAIGALYIFFVFSHATEFIDSSGRLHLVMMLALGGAVAAVLAGELPDSLKSRPGIALTLFTLFLVLGIPFSSWKGGSVRSLIDTWWKSYLTFLLVAGLIFTLKQIRTSFFVLAGATVGIIYFAFRALKTYGDDRISVEYGSLGNSNDLAGALLLGLPFLFYILLDKKRAALIRLPCVGLIGVLLMLVVKTGSRASLLVVVLMAVLSFFQANGANKLKVLVLCGVAASCFPFFVTKDLMVRYKTMFTDTQTAGMSDTAVSAIDSTHARQQLMRNALELTIRHPIFGVGIGNFSNQSADLEMSKGRPPLWFTAHDIYLLVSSETGIIGFIFFMATLVFSYRTLARIGRASKGVPGLEDVPSMTFTLMMSLTAYCACGIFATNAYTMQMPAMAALTVALDRVTRPYLVAAEQRRMELFRRSIPVAPSKYAKVSAAAMALR